MMSQLLVWREECALSATTGSGYSDDVHDRLERVGVTGLSGRDEQARRPASGLGREVVVLSPPRARSIAHRRNTV